MNNIGTDLTKQINGQDTSSWNCPECGKSKTQYSLQIIPTGRNDNYPRWVLQIKECCSSCGRYKRFAPQAPILIKRFNDRLQSIILPATGRDFYEK